MTESGSLMYQRVEKPAQIVRERLSLNEYCTAISTGTIAHSMYAHVNTTRKRGRPHGLPIQPRTRRAMLGRAVPCGDGGHPRSSFVARATVTM